MEIYYIILGIIFVFVLLAWWVFESGTVFDVMDKLEIEKRKELDRLNKKL